MVKRGYWVTEWYLITAAGWLQEVFVPSGRLRDGSGFWSTDVERRLGSWR
jgi:hypothetical protein